MYVVHMFTLPPSYNIMIHIFLLAIYRMRKNCKKLAKWNSVLDCVASLGM